MPPGAVRAEDVRQMLGLADRTRVVDLFETLMRGDMPARSRNCAINTIPAPIRPWCSPISPSSRIS